MPPPVFSKPEIGSSRSSTSVSSVIMQTPSGSVSTAISGIACPGERMKGWFVEDITGTMSRSTTGRLRIWRLTMPAASEPNWTDASSGGASTSLSAVSASAFRMVTRSPMPTSAFWRVKPSTRTVSVFQSCRSARHTFAAVVSPPSISMMSPGDSFRWSSVSGSRRAIPRPESFGYAFATSSCTSFMIGSRGYCVGPRGPGISLLSPRTPGARLAIPGRRTTTSV